MKIAACGTLAVTTLAGLAAGQTAPGPSSSATPYLVPFPGGPAVAVYSILTAGDSVNLKPDGVSPFVMVGLPDGLGALAAEGGLTRILMGHELGATAGIPRAHGGTGSFVSDWTIDGRPTLGDGSPNPSFLSVLHGQDLDTTLSASTPGSGSLTQLNRLCSGDLALPSAFHNPATGLGTLDPIFLDGEEGSGGRVIAHTPADRTATQLTAWDGLNGAWENALARPFASDTTVVIATSDGGDNRVFLYRGTKLAEGSTLEKAGLTNGSVWGIQIVLEGVNVAAESRFSGFAASGDPVLTARFTLTPGRSGTSFSRPEDGAWDPADPRDFYFVTTDRLDTTDGGSGPVGQEGRSRLWRLRFDDASDPDAGGTIEAVIDGTGGPGKPNMMDNLCITHGRNGHTYAVIQEDTGNASHNAKVWLVDVTAGTRRILLQHDPARFGDVGVAPTAPFTVDEESSGVIDAEGTLGKGWFLCDVQDHHGIPGELVEGGQLVAFYIPEIGSLCAADFNADGFVDFMDYAAFVGCFEGSCTPGSTADANGDGFVDFFDYIDFVAAFEAGC